MRVPALPQLSAVVVGGLVAAIAILGVALRLDDPLSSPAIGAEDPYTHIVFTKEALARGWFGDSFHLGTPIYPPGIHAFTGALATVAGVSLYDFARFAPPLLGGLAVIGMFVLARRLAGVPAGLAAALVTAVLPEHVFRTNLYFPTAFDLAILPLYLLAFDLVVRGETSAVRYGAAALFVTLSVPLAFLHPWAVVLFALPLAAYAAVRIVREGASGFGAAVRSVLLPAGALVVAVAFAMASRWDQSDTGFADFFAQMGPLAVVSQLAFAPPQLFVALVIVLGAAGVVPMMMLAWVASRATRPPTWIALAAGSVLLAGAFWLARNPDPGVTYGAMLGGVAITLACIGWIAAFWRPSPLGDMAVLLALVLFPLTVLNPFDSPFWPQRTVAYLAIAVALLAGVAAHALAGTVERVSMRRARLIAPRYAPAVAVIGTLAIVGTAFAVQPADTYRWYRLYSDESFGAFEETADMMNADADVRVIVRSWQPGLVLKALADPAQVRYSPAFYADADERQDVLDEHAGPTFVVVDKHALRAEEDGKADLSFLDGGGYRLVKEADDGRFKLYEVAR